MRAEGGRDSALPREGRGLRLGKAALGAYRDGEVAVLGEQRGERQRMAAIAVSHDDGAAMAREQSLERGGRFDDGYEEAAGLLGCLHGDAAPACEPRLGGGVAALGEGRDGGADDVRTGLGPAIVEPGGIAHAALTYHLSGDASGMNWWASNRPSELSRWLDCLELCDACDDHEEAARYIELQRIRRRRHLLADAIQHAADSVAAGADPLVIVDQIDQLRGAAA